MSIFSKLRSKSETGEKVGGMEDFMYLIRVYYQSVMAAKLGITSLQALPDLRIFKQTLHVPTVNNKLGLGEKKRCQKMLEELYQMPDTFFKEIDSSIQKKCTKMQDAQNYLYLFQGFTQELMMVVTNTLQMKLRIPGFFKKILRTVVEQGINDILTKDNWKDAGIRKSVGNVRAFQKSLGYSETWMTEFVYRVVLLAKKEPKKKDDESEAKK